MLGIYIKQVRGFKINQSNRGTPLLTHRFCKNKYIRLDGASIVIKNDVDGGVGVDEMKL